MTILAWMGTTVADYQADYHKWWDRVEQELVCQCGHAFRRHSTRSRAAWTAFCNHLDERILLLRLYCPHCHVTHTVLPDLLKPFHRYQTPVREAVLTAVEAEPCSRPTLTRWKRALSQAVPMAIHHLTSWLLKTCPQHRQASWALTGEMQGMDGLRRLRHFAEQAGRLAHASCLFGWVNREIGKEICFMC